MYNDCVAVPPLQMIDDLASFSTCSSDSIVTNAIINGKIEAKKLDFGPSKCFNIHIGEKENCCEGLKVHENSIKRKKHETYLGDVICSTGSNNKNVEKRRNSGTGAVSQVISTLSQVTLGHNHFETALIFRDSMVVSKLVSSAEVWYNITKDQYEKLEEIDELFLMKIFELPESVPRLSLYIECGLIPIRFIIKMRRLMYYWQILHLDKDELLYKFYLAQSLKPGKNDWVLQIVQDKSDIQLDMSEADILKTSKNKFKSIIQSKINLSVKNYFQQIQAKQTKTSHLKITENFRPAKYLSSRNLNPAEIQTLFRLRSRTISVKNNHGSFI